MDTTTTGAAQTGGAAGTQLPATEVAPRPAAAVVRPLARGHTLASACSLLVAALIAAVSVVGLAGDPAARYGASSSVLVSRGADAANLALVLPALLAALWLARRGALAGLLLWPGALLYALYAYVPYLIGAPFSALVFGYVALVTFATFTCIGLLASIDGAAVRARLARVRARGFGGALVVVAALAYAGLAATAVGALAGPPGDPARRGHWVADWAVGTPALLLGGALLWRRAALGYVVAAGLFLVSALGGLVFALAAALDNLLAGPRTAPATIATHLVIAALSAALLAAFLRGAGRPPAGEGGGRERRMARRDAEAAPEAPAGLPAGRR